MLTCMGWLVTFSPQGVSGTEGAWGQSVRNGCVYYLARYGCVQGYLFSKDSRISACGTKCILWGRVNLYSAVQHFWVSVR